MKHYAENELLITRIDQPHDDPFADLAMFVPELTADGYRPEARWLEAMSRTTSLQDFVGHRYDIARGASIGAPWGKLGYLAKRGEQPPGKLGPFAEPDTREMHDVFWLDPNEPARGHHTFDRTLRVSLSEILAAHNEPLDVQALAEEWFPDVRADDSVQWVPGGPWCPRFEAEESGGWVTWLGWMAAIETPPSRVLLFFSGERFSVETWRPRRPRH